MLLHDDRTGRGHPLPHPDNLMEDDVQRLREAIGGLDQDVTALEGRIGSAEASVVELQAGKAASDLSNVPAAAFKAKAAASGSSLPDVTAADAGKSLVVSPDGTGYQVGASASAVQQTAPLYAPGGAGFNLTGKSVLAAYEQTVGSIFAYDFNNRSAYAEQDPVSGTDAVGGAFQLHNTAGAGVDANTKLLIHADGVNGSTEIIDERGITPFGTHCAYFDGSAGTGFKIPSSFKVAFGTTQDYTVECWGRWGGALGGTVSGVLFDFMVNGGNNRAPRVMVGGGNWYFAFDTYTWTGSGVDLNWHHFAFVRRASTLYFYLDGVQVFSQAASLNTDARAFTLGIGNDMVWNPWIGWMDQFRVSKVARYTDNFTPPTAEFTPDPDTVYLLQFNDGHGSQFIRDNSKSGHEIQVGSSLSNAWAKFGATSLRLSSSASPTRIAPTKPHGDLVLGALDFTLDMQARFDGVATNQILAKFDDTSSYGLEIYLNGATGNLELYASSNGTSYDLASGVVIGSMTANVAAHVALSRVGTSLYLFKDGVLTNTVAIGTASIRGAGQVRLGSNSVGTNKTNGYVDALRFDRRGLWSASFTAPTTAPTATDTTVLLCQFEGVNGDTVALDSSESSYGSNGFGDTTTPTLTFAGSATLDATYTRGGHGTSLKLNGTTQYASIAYATPSAGHPIYFSASDKLCLEGWFYIASFTGNPILVSLTATSGNTLSFLANAAGFTLSANGGTVLSVPATWGGTGWHHVAIVRDPRGWGVAVDGTFYGGYAPQLNLIYPNEAYTLNLGTFNVGVSNFLNGAIDSFRITHGKPRYTTNFTPGNLVADDDTALLWVFDGTVGQKWVKELSKNTVLIQSTNARTVKDGRYISFNPGTGTLSLLNNIIGPKFGTNCIIKGGNGTSNFIMPHNASLCPSVDFTIEGLMYGYNYTSFTRTMMYKWNGSTTTWALRVNSGGDVTFNYVDTGGTTITITGGASSITAGNWSHVAAVRNGTTLSIYVDGVLKGSVTATLGMRQDTTGNLFIGTDATGAAPMDGGLDEMRISSVARWTSNFTPPTLAYGQQYVTGPYWVATKPGLSALDLSAFSSVDSAALTGSTPPNTSLKFLLSTDGYATPLKRWTGLAWAATAHSMVWSAGAGTLTTSATSTQFASVANTWAELLAGLLALDLTSIASLNVVAILSTTNQQFTPVLDQITLALDEYQLMQPGVDYTIKRKRALGVQTLEFKRLKAGNANHVIDYIG
ncbi:hypothetical protein J2847_000822 [Azospirillum agricola]|uniref:LamG domain-containing protein n=1 Tax=Azospirillum agricola TaxID=1720247 RepID=UPI001AE2DCA7|nr:LamG-like jellyroll fold domain-containing protein [Azospirillum agricola]MBP2227542.1 hypothetical protein [Azospirillum agricola]